MCKDFSCVVTQSHQVFWKRGTSSHDHIIELFKADNPQLTDSRHVKVEITPDKGYLYPDGGWTLKVDEDETPSWFTGAHKKECMRSLEQWKKEVYALINLEEARNLINPLKLLPSEVTETDIENLKKWASVGVSVLASVWASVRDSVSASVGDSVWASVWVSVLDSVLDSVWASVRDSVRAYTGSLFNIWGGDYKYQPIVDLWKRGFVASFDDKTWRLHSGENAAIVYEWQS